MLCIRAGRNSREASSVVAGGEWETTGDQLMYTGQNNIRKSCPKVGPQITIPPPNESQNTSYTPR